MKDYKHIKVMISQPMKDKSDDEIEENWGRIKDKLLSNLDKFNKALNENYDPRITTGLYIMGTFVQNYFIKTDLECFAESVKFLSEADILVMAEDWENSKGCKLEHSIAKAYGLPIVYEGDL